MATWQQIRAFQQARARERRDPRDISRELHTRFGVGRLASWRLGHGWSQSKAAEQISRRLRMLPGVDPDKSIDRRRLADFEGSTRNRRPGRALMWAVAQTYGIALEETGFFDEYIAVADPDAAASAERLDAGGPGSIGWAHPGDDPPMREDAFSAGLTLAG